MCIAFILRIAFVIIHLLNLLNIHIKYFEFTLNKKNVFELPLKDISLS